MWPALGLPPTPPLSPAGMSWGPACHPPQGVLSTPSHTQARHCPGGLTPMRLGLRALLASGWGGDLPEADWGRGGHQPGRGPSGARPGGRTVLRWRGDGNLPLGHSLRSLPGQLQIPSQCHSCAQGQPVDFSPPSSRPPVQTRNQEGWPRPPLLAGRLGPAFLGISGHLPCGG